MPTHQLLIDNLNPETMRYFSFAHAQDHEDIRQALNTQHGTDFGTYDLDPMPTTDLRLWLQRHQQAHDDMNSTLGIGGTDVSSLNIRDQEAVKRWLWQNFIEHTGVSSALKI